MIPCVDSLTEEETSVCISYSLAYQYEKYIENRI
jgi:hypothetical protein